MNPVSIGFISQKSCSACALQASSIAKGIQSDFSRIQTWNFEVVQVTESARESVVPAHYCAFDVLAQQRSVCC